jgi:hypothetical protein
MCVFSIDNNILPEDILKDEEYDRKSTDSINKETKYNIAEDDNMQLGKLKKANLKNIKSYLPYSKSRNDPLLHLPIQANNSFLLNTKIVDDTRIRPSNSKGDSDSKHEKTLDFKPPTFSRIPIDNPSPQTNMQLDVIESSVVASEFKTEKLYIHHFFELIATDIKFLFPLDFSFLSTCPEISLPTFKKLILIQDYLYVSYKFYFLFFFFIGKFKQHIFEIIAFFSLCQVFIGS